MARRSLVTSAARVELAKLRASCEARVARWEHATSTLWSLEPCYFERHQFGRGRRLARAPGAKKDFVSYGWTSTDEAPAIVRSNSAFLGRVHEEIYYLPRDGDVVESYRVRVPGDELLNVERHHFRESRVVAHEILFRVAKKVGREDFEWDGPRLRRVVITNWGDDHTEELEHDDAGLARIWWVGPKGRSVVWQRPAKGESLTALLGEIQRHIVALVPRVVAAAKLRDPAYCLVLAVDGEEPRYYLPPCLGVGTVAERDRHLATLGKEAPHSIWSPYEMATYERELLRLDDAALHEVCTRANHRVLTASRHGAALKMVRAAAAELAELDWGALLPVTDDFVVYAVDVEAADGAREVKKVASPAVRRKLSALGAL